MLSRSSKNFSTSSRNVPLPPMNHLPSRHLNRNPSTVLSSSPLGLILQKRSEKHMHRILMQNLAASKSRTSQKQFLQYQHHYYQKILKERDQKLNTLLTNQSCHRRELSLQRLTTRTKLIEKMKSEQSLKKKQAYQHFKDEESKIQAASLKKSSCYSHAHSSQSRSSTIRHKKEQQEQFFASSVHQEILEKQRKAIKNLNELTKRRMQRERQRQMRMTQAYNKKLSNYEEFQQSSLVNLMSGMGRSQVKLNQLESIEKSLIANHSKHTEQAQQKALLTKDRTVKVKQERILRQIDNKKRKIEEAQQKRQMKRKSWESNSKSSSSHISEVLKKGSVLKEKDHNRAQQKTFRTMDRYQKIDAFKQESERMRQMIIAGRFDTH